MAIKEISFIVLCLFILSCNQNNDLKYAELIEAKLNSNDFKQVLSSNGECGGFGIKKVTVISQITTNIEANKVFNEMSEEKLRAIDVLSLKGLVKATVIKEESGRNKFNDQVNMKNILIEPTESGKKLLVGETHDKYIFNVFDYEGIQIINVKENADTVLVDFKIIKANKTDAYGMLPDFEQTLFPKNHLDKLESAKILIRNKEYEVLSIQ